MYILFISPKRTSITVAYCTILNTDLTLRPSISRKRPSSQRGPTKEVDEPTTGGMEEGREGSEESDDNPDVSRNDPHE